MKNMLIYLVLVLISFHAVAEDNSSAPPPKINNTDTLKLHDLDNSLKHHSGNIISIRQEDVSKVTATKHNEKDGEYTDSVLFVISEINNDVEDLVVKQNLLGAMETEQGKSKMAAHKNNDTKLFKEKCTSYLAELNQGLTKLTDAALTAEVKGARDDTVKICDIIQRWQ
jgi:hypothetical protein